MFSAWPCATKFVKFKDVFSLYLGKYFPKYIPEQEPKRVGPLNSETKPNPIFGSSSEIYLGKYFPKYKLNTSLNLTNFVAHGHAENTLGLKFNYYFYK